MILCYTSWDNWKKPLEGNHQRVRYVLTYHLILPYTYEHTSFLFIRQFFYCIFYLSYHVPQNTPYDDTSRISYCVRNVLLFLSVSQR